MRLRFLPSFVKRKGRITQKQENNLKFLENYQITDLKEIISQSSSFKKCCLEIGFGNAENLIYQATQNPNILFIGSEVYRSGIGILIGRIRENNINNIMIYPDDVRILLDDIQDPIFDGITIICPDPWPKERHHKRRLINNNFVNKLHSVMKENAQLQITTDWKNYAEIINEIFESNTGFKELKEFFLKKSNLSKFESRGLDEGRKIYQFFFQKLTRS